MRATAAPMRPLAPVITEVLPLSWSRVFQGSAGRVEAAEAPVAVLVVPLRLDPAPHPDAASNSIVGVREDAGTNAGEKGGAVGRPLLRLGRLERQAEHRGEDPEP